MPGLKFLMLMFSKILFHYTFWTLFAKHNLVAFGITMTLAKSKAPIQIIVSVWRLGPDPSWGMLAKGVC